MPVCPPPTRAQPAVTQLQSSAGILRPLIFQEGAQCEHAAFALIGAAGAVVSACATRDWMGAEAEKAYDKDLEIQRLASVLNNDDYYEFEKGRPHLRAVRRQGLQRRHDDRRAAFSTKKIGGGPGGKDHHLRLTKNETKILGEDRSPRRRAEDVRGDLKVWRKTSSQSSCAAMRLRLTSWKDLEAFRSQGQGKGYAAARAAVA